MNFQKNKRITDVYFSGGFFHHILNEKKGKKTSVDISFTKDGKNWFIPAYYTCSKGLVFDVCVETTAEEYNAFAKKWDIYNADSFQHLTNDEFQLFEKENPLNHNFSALLIRNKKLILNKQTQSIVYSPDNTDNKEAAKLVRLYKLNEKNCWSFYRINFPCNTKSLIKTLALKIVAENEFINAAKFTASQGDKVEIIHPLNKKKYTLSVLNITDETFSFNNAKEDMSFPNNYKMMQFTLSPEPKKSKFFVRDTKNSDSPEIKKTTLGFFLPESSNSIAVIGGADGPTVLSTEQATTLPTIYTVCSSLHYEKQDEILWKFTFIEKTKEDKTVTIKGGKDDLWQNWKDVFAEGSMNY